MHERVPLSTNGGSNGLAVGAREDTTVVSWCHVFYGLGSLIKYENKPKTNPAKHILNAGVKNIFFLLCEQKARLYEYQADYECY